MSKFEYLRERRRGLQLLGDFDGLHDPVWVDRIVHPEIGGARCGALHFLCNAQEVFNLECTRLPRSVKHQSVDVSIR